MSEDWKVSRRRSPSRLVVALEGEPGGNANRAVLRALADGEAEGKISRNGELVREREVELLIFDVVATLKQEA